MSIYAKNTSVAVEKSRGEIEAILARYGATEFAYATKEGKAMIRFQANGRSIMFILELPDRNADRFVHVTHGKKVYLDRDRTPEWAYELWEQECRQKWRCLALAIKAKLEAVESGITSFEDEFMAHIVMPDGKTLSKHITPMIQKAYETKKMPALLPYFD